MPKKTLEELKKMVAGRNEHFANTKGEVCRVADRIVIYCDEHQFILKIDDKIIGYYGDITHIIEYLYSMKAKELMLKDDRKNLISVKESYEMALQWIEYIVEPMLK